MGTPVFYLPATDIDTDRGTVLIDGAEGRHLARSLRARRGDPISIGDSAGTLYEGVVASVAGDSVACTLASSRYFAPERPQVVVFQALAKDQAMDEAVALAAESGAARFVPFPSKRSPYEALRKGAARSERWQTIGREASRTARRPWPLDVREVAADGLEKGLVDSAALCLVMWEERRDRPLKYELPECPPRSIGIVVGPEGGFEHSEVEAMRALGCGAAGLGELNLRARTAGAYAVMIVRYHYGLLEPAGEPGE